MTDHEPNLTRLPSSEKSPTKKGGHDVEVAATEPLHSQERSRWAELVASGVVPFPEGLSAAEAERLVCEVARRRRSRLVQFVARAIAADIYRSREAKHGD